MAIERFDFFISYSSKNAAAAESLEAQLLGAGKTVFRDEAGVAAREAAARGDAEGLRPGQNIHEAIPSALRRSKAVIVLWSAESAGSEYVKAEAGAAWGAGKIIQLHIAPFDPSALPSPYSSLRSEPLEATLSSLDNLLKRFEEIEKASPSAAIETWRLPKALNAFVARETELAMLGEAWATGEPNVITLIAAGGTGKTMLAGAFLDSLGEQNYAGAEAVYAFSFDSQGTDEKRQGSSDLFFAEALKFFGEKSEDYDGGRARASRLAAMLRETRALLILDGLEPMQSFRPGDPENGRLRDDAMNAFLTEISRSNAGLCVVTTRLPIADLNGFGAAQARQIRLPNLPLSAGVAMLRGDGLDYPNEQLEALVREYGQEVAAEEAGGDSEFRCHAKAVALIGGFIKKNMIAKGHAPTIPEFHAAFAMPDEAFLGEPNEALKKRPGYAVYRMVRRYEILLEETIAEQAEAREEAEAARQLALLRTMGLFDRPAPWAAVACVLAEPAIPGLTEGLGAVDETLWRNAVKALREDGLLNPDPEVAEALGPESLLDAHPLIREYFARRLALTAPESFRAAHGRLYDFYRYDGLPAAFREPVAYGVLALGAEFPDARFRQDIEALADRTLPEGVLEIWPPVFAGAEPDALRRTALLIDGPSWSEALKQFQPEDEAGMRPLFAAIAHACAADRSVEAFVEVYRPRIIRGNAAFATRKLGLYGADLSALAHFFASPFSAVAADFTPQHRALLFGDAGFNLRAQGRLAEAEAPIRGALDANLKLEIPRHAAVAAGNLSGLLVALGRLRDAPGGAAGAVSAGALAVKQAEESGDAPRRMAYRTAHGDALLAAGSWTDAGALFAEAERLQRENQPSMPLLYALQGYHGCDLKLAQGRADEVAARGDYGLQLSQNSDFLLDIGLSELTLGRAAHQTARRAAGEAREQALRTALALLEAAVEALKKAGAVEFIVRGNLARAACRREVGRLDLAAEDLDAARDIARRGGMRLFLCDAALESAWLAMQRAADGDADAHLAAAESEIATAEKLIRETGYERRLPDLALARAALALLRGDRAAAESEIDKLIAAMRAHDLWSFLPDLEDLVEHFDLAARRPEIEDLRAERQAFDTAADAAFEEARKPGEAAPALPDELVDAMLADEGLRAMLAKVYADNNVDIPFDQIPREAHADTLAKLVAAGVIKLGEPEDGDVPEADGPSDDSTEEPPAAENPLVADLDERLDATRPPPEPQKVEAKKKGFLRRLLGL